jgi:FdhE protein
MNLWDRRIERALVLESEYPSAAELLQFYRQIAAFQKGISGAALPSAPLSVHPACLPEPLTPYLHPLLDLLERTAPPPLAKAASGLRFYRDWDPADPTPRFVTRVLVQPYAEQLARRGPPSAATVTADCPFCREPAVLAVLRPEGEGGKRSLVCSLCFTEWEYRRLLCPKCGEEDHQKLAVYTTEAFAHVRIEACDTCRTYLKAIDLTRNGLAVPEVDEIAAVALDVWAAEKGYTKLQANLFGL